MYNVFKLESRDIVSYYKSYLYMIYERLIKLWSMMKHLDFGTLSHHLWSLLSQCFIEKKCNKVAFKHDILDSTLNFYSFYQRYPQIWSFQSLSNLIFSRQFITKFWNKTYWYCFIIFGYFILYFFIIYDYCIVVWVLVHY